MTLNYIDENLEKITENLENVLYIKPYNIGHKRALFAVVKEGAGIYKKIKITKEESRLTFPFEPLLLFDNFLLKDFIVLNSNNLALNKNWIDGFKIIKHDFNRSNIDIYAVFSDKSATFVRTEREKTFNKNGGIDSFNKFLENYNVDKVNNNEYRIIEYYFPDDSDIIEIPILKNSDQIDEEKAPVKKLVPKQNKEQ